MYDLSKPQARYLLPFSADKGDIHHCDPWAILPALTRSMTHRVSQLLEQLSVNNLQSLAMGWPAVKASRGTRLPSFITSARDTQDCRVAITAGETNAVSVIANHRILSVLPTDSILLPHSNTYFESRLESAHRHHIGSRHQRFQSYNHSRRHKCSDSNI